MATLASVYLSLPLALAWLFVPDLLTLYLVSGLFVGLLTLCRMLLPVPTGYCALAVVR